MSEFSDALGRLRGLRAAGASVADEPAGKELLRALGLSVPQGLVAAGVDEAVEAARALGGPVAVKLVAQDLPHKSDVGAVAGPLDTPAAVRAAAARIVRPEAVGLLVERWHDGGVACFAGLALHTAFGPVVSFGLGGVWVEILRDVAHRLAPVSEREAREMALSLRAAPLLLGARGRPAVDLSALAASVSRLSRLAADEDARELVDEVDVNPLLALESGTPVALDATVVLRPVAPAHASAPTSSVAHTST
jgi:succinyl-CoA synthetase beta subunit